MTPTTTKTNNADENAYPFLSDLTWGPDGLIPAIVQDETDGTVLMMAWMNAASLARTVASGQTHFYSRSRKQFWHKGGTSGHVQYVSSIAVDCDADVLLIRVRQVGGACHEGYRTCFSRQVDADTKQLSRVLKPIFAPEHVYASGPPRADDAHNGGIPSS